VFPAAASESPALAPPLEYESADFLHSNLTTSGTSDSSCCVADVWTGLGVTRLSMLR
jgi:hypothetical protein